MPINQKDIQADKEEITELVFLELSREFTFSTLISNYRWRGLNAFDTLLQRQTIYAEWTKNPDRAAYTTLKWGGVRNSCQTSYALSTWQKQFAECPSTDIVSVITEKCQRTSLSAAKNWGIASWSKILAHRFPSSFFILDSRVSNAINSCLLRSELPKIRRCFPVFPRRKDSRVAIEKVERANENLDLLLNLKHAEVRISGKELYVDIYLPMITEIASRLESTPSLTSNISELPALRKALGFNPFPHLVEMALFQKGDLAHD